MNRAHAAHRITHTIRRRRTQQRSAYALAFVAAAALMLGASPARAAGFFSMQGGVFGPWQGDTGYALGLQLLGGGASGRARFGGEFEYRSFDTRILGVNDIDIETYSIRAVWQQHFMPDNIVTPYIGIALGIVFTNVDDRKIDGTIGTNVRDDSGAGLEGQFIFGIDAAIPNSEYMSIFGEGRIGFGYEFNGRADKDRVEAENIGGVHGQLGLRFRF